ncbi:hypothetical protein [Bacillus seohaeanensis]|uniref:Phage protein n=1 Tax=Bacillus seohaeanensis TaxID=284580 RepID=A0ABW5RRB7_9BACI
MLIRKGNRFELYPHKVKGIRFGEAFEQWATPSKEWWTEVANKHDHTEVTEFIEVALTDEQLTRFEEIKNMPEDFTSVYMDYVLDGTLPNSFPEAHPFRQIMLKNENRQLKKQLDNAIIELTTVMAMQGGTV